MLRVELAKVGSDFRFVLPTTIDAEGDSVSITVDLNTADSIITYDVDTSTFAIKDPIKTISAKEYPITVTLADDKGKSATYTIVPYVAEEPIVEEPLVITGPVFVPEFIDPQPEPIDIEYLVPRIKEIT